MEQCEERLATAPNEVRRLQSVFAEISNKFRDHGIEYAVLQGFTQTIPDFVADLYLSSPIRTMAFSLSGDFRLSCTGDIAGTGLRTAEGNGQFSRRITCP